MNEENLTAKTPSGDFQVTTFETPLLSQQKVTSKGIPVPYTNLQLNTYPNSQLNLFYSDSSSFRCTTPSTWLTNCADLSTWLQSPTKKVVGCKILQFIHTIKIRKMLGHKTLRCKYTATSPRKRWTRSRTLSPVTICLNRICSMLVQLVYHLMALKIILLYV